MSNDPHAPPKVVKYDKVQAARAHLETAITLWFNYGDVSSIQTLAYAANDCYDAIGGEKTPGIVKCWLSTRSKAEYDHVQDSINFCKHGLKNVKGTTSVESEYAELLLLDAVVCHQRLFQEWTPLMRCFYARFTLENPRLIELMTKPLAREYFRHALEVERLGDLNRVDYLYEVLPVLTEGFPMPPGV